LIRLLTCKLSVYKKDEESFSIWKDKIGLPNEKIQCKGDHDNFWSMGDEGPCGPCTEIFWDTHQGKNEDER
jgi:alanyl-tRNA synthetase